MARRKSTKEFKEYPKRGKHPGHYIKEWRLLRGMTQKEVAEKMAFTNGALSQLETGRTAYRQDMLEELAKALDCTPADLLRKPDSADQELSQMSEDQRLKAIEIMKVMGAPATATTQVQERATVPRPRIASAKMANGKI